MDRVGVVGLKCGVRTLGGVAMMVSLLACGGGGDDPPDQSFQDNGGATCDGTSTTYIVRELQFPSLEMAENGELVGFDLDGVSDACERDDWEGGEGDVDNVLIVVLDVLTGAVPELDIQNFVDGLLCGGAEGAEPLEIGFEVTRGADCTTLSVLDPAGEPLVGPFDVTLTGNLLEGSAPQLPLTITDPALPDGSISLTFENVRFSFEVGTDELTNIVVGGTITAADIIRVAGVALDVVFPPDEFTTDPNDDLPSPTITLETARVLIQGLYDIPNGAGVCGEEGGASFGVLGTARTGTTLPMCPVTE